MKGLIHIYYIPLMYLLCVYLAIRSFLPTSLILCLLNYGLKILEGLYTCLDILICTDWLSSWFKLTG